MEDVELMMVLLSKGLIRFGEFTLTSGRRSTIYVDLRPLPSFPDEFRLIAGELARRIGRRAICGIAVGGLPLATAVAIEAGVPLIYVRKERKEHGTARLLEGVVEEGREYVVVDDVATTGGSLERAIGEVRARGGEVREAWVVVDRVQGARERLESIGVALRSLGTLPDMVRSVLDSLGDDERTFAERYLAEVGG